MMLRKVFRNTSLAIVSLTLFFLIFLTEWSTAIAATPGFTPPDNYRKDDSLEISPELTETNKEIEKPKDEISMEDIFGSDQVFPFEMGLGNSAF